MILALDNDKYCLQMKLKTDYGVPQYILESLEEPALRRMIDKLPQNPWAFYDKDSGFSIRLCERLAEKFKINNSLEKCKAYLQYSIDCAANQGHCYAKEWQINHIIKDCNFTDYDMQKAIDFLTKENILFVSDKGNYFLSKYFNAEKKFASLMLNQAGLNGMQTGFTKYYSNSYSKLTDLQKEVVDAVETNSLIILTGLPGTGKTTTMRSIVSCYGDSEVLLFAPTGKAAVRLGQLCGAIASTLHSFFLNAYGNKVIENKIIIIDESSMMDAEIAGCMAECIGNGCVIVLVGDPDQLPSVGPGQILRDMLKSGIGTHFHLNEIMRQKPGSLLKSAHSIHSGNNLIQEQDREVITYFPKEWDLEKIVTRLLLNDEWKDAQILSVLKEKCSTVINKIIQNKLFPDSKQIFNLNDKVIHTKNNKDLNIYNGEIGKVVRKTDRLTYVEYQDKIIEYPYALLWQLELAYSVTVHKFQGSEADKVIFFVNPSQITNKNLFYTGLTRAKRKILIIAPNESVITNAINNTQKSRQTTLPWLLKESE